MMRVRAISAFLVAASLLAQTTPATKTFEPQAPSQDVTIRINVNLVQVDAQVLDSKDRPVTNLKAEDFEILQDGKPQVITNFGYISVKAPNVRVIPAVQQKKGVSGGPPPPPPKLKPNQIRRTVAMVVDDLGLSFESIARVRQSLKKFVDEQMQPGDLVAIIRTGAGMGALQSFTADKRMLYAAIDRVKFNAFGRTSIGSFGGSDGTRADEFRETWFSVGTLGAINYVVNGLKELPGRKSILLFSENMRMFNSEGANTEVMDNMRKMTDAANRASVVIYTLDPRGLETLQLTAADDTRDMSAQQISEAHSQRVQQHWDSQEGLNFLANETGGIFFHDNNDINGGVKRVMEDQDGYYLIGYHPDAATFDAKTGRRLFHSVRVRVKTPGLHVRYRKGFYGVSDVATKPSTGNTRDEQLSHALTSPFGATGIGLHLTSLFSYAGVPTAAQMKARATAQAAAAKEAAKKATTKKAKEQAAWDAKYQKSLDEAAKTGLYISTLLHIDANDLTFVDDAVLDKNGNREEGWKKAVIDILAITFGDNGTPIDSTNNTYTIRMRGKSLEQAMKSGFIYSMRHPVRKPGAYQMRVALRDASSEKVGSASQYVEVPDVRKGRLVLSGIVLKGDAPAPAPGAAAAKPAASAAASAKPPATPAPAAQPAQTGAVAQAAQPAASPLDHPEGQMDEPDPRSSAALRIFKPGLGLTYGYQVLNAQAGPASEVRLEVQTRLFRDGQQVYEGKPSPFNPKGQPDMSRIVSGGRMQLGKGMTPGDYVLQVIVKDTQARDPKASSATQWQTFEVEPK